MVSVFVGFESANSYVKSVSSLQDSEVDIYLNSLTEINEKDAFSPKGELIANTYNVEGRYFKVGLVPTRLEQESSAGDRVSRYEDERYKIESLIAIYRQVQSHKQLKQVNIYVTTGVSVNHDSEDVKDTIKRQLEGTHVINGKEFTIKEVAIMLQSHASFFSEVFDSNAEYNLDFVEKAEGKELLVVDIGNGTTDIVHINDLAKVNTSMIKGFSHIWKQLKEVAEGKSTRFKSANLPLLWFQSQLLKSNAIKEFDLDLSEEKEKIFNDYVKTLINHIELNYKIDALTEIIITGGGSIGLKRNIQNYVRDTFNDSATKRKFRFLSNPQFSNVTGYLRYCMNAFK